MSGPGRFRVAVFAWPFSRGRFRVRPVFAWPFSRGSSKDAVLRQRILTKLTKDGDAVKYDELIEDCINFLSTIHEAKLIEATSVSSKTANQAQLQLSFNVGDVGKRTTPTENARTNRLSVPNVATMRKGIDESVERPNNGCLWIVGWHQSQNQLSDQSLQRRDAEKKINQLKQEFTNVFKNELGLCTKVKAHLELKTDAQPIYRKARPVPYNAKDAVDGELDRWEKMGVIGKVEHTEWAAPILVVKKADGSARLCIDYSTGLNNALKDHQHPLPLPEDIFATLNGGQYFHKLIPGCVSTSEAGRSIEKAVCHCNPQRKL
ncbi:hypothetical protein niasHT_015079 [Heterodera trifolii]|uniref:Reverse transcriptase n=1 Tax=Heterodera trifolii TaxID=157864 RepID=A0ABD2L9Y6_9BILA